jgi:hypothetical protein
MCKDAPRIRRRRGFFTLPSSVAASVAALVPALDAGAGLRQTSPVLVESAIRMGKYLLLFVGAVVVFWVVRAALRRRARDRVQRAQSAVANDDMVCCLECGVHLPRGESLTVQGRFYCSVEHQRRHQDGA